MLRGLGSAVHCTERRKAGVWNILEGQGWSHRIATVPTHPPDFQVPRPVWPLNNSLCLPPLNLFQQTWALAIRYSERINSGTKISIQTSKKFYHHAKIQVLHLVHFSGRWKPKLPCERLPTVTVAAHSQICPYKLVLITSQTTARKFKWGLCDLDSWFPFLGVKPIKIFYPDFLFLFGEFVVCQECQLFI